jgi:hypothetical protein
MIDIARADEELFGTVVMAARFGRVDAIVKHLSARYEQEWDDPHAGFPYALSMLAVLHSGRPEAREHLNYTEIIETLSDLLYHEPGHWLGRYLRIHARALLPADAEEHRNYLIAERARAADDAQDLIDRQARGPWRPWYAVPYLLAARLAWESAEPDREQRVAALVTAATARPAEPVGFRALGSLMSDVFRWYGHQGDVPHRDAVRALAADLFRSS